MNRAELARAIAGRLVVSCQAGPGPLRDTATMVRFARAAVAGGAAAIRCGGYGGVADVAAIVAAIEVPVIGLTKSDDPDVYITPTVAAAVAVAAAGAAVVASDATGRPRPDGSTWADIVAAVHGHGALVMADVSTLAEAVAAHEAGADVIATTLSGYTPASPPADGPDLGLVAAIRSAVPSAVIVAEGRIHTPGLAAEALRTGATSVVVGTAITDPAWITARFAGAVAAAAATGERA